MSFSSGCENNFGSIALVHLEALALIAWVLVSAPDDTESDGLLVFLGSFFWFFPLDFFMGLCLDGGDDGDWDLVFLANVVFQ